MSEDRSTAVIIAGLNVSYIGKTGNGGSHPMAHPGRFSDAIQAGAYRCGLRQHTSGTGIGSWGGITERSLIFAGTLPTAALPLLRAELSVLAADYGQEAIGLVVDHGDTLVRP